MWSRKIGHKGWNCKSKEINNIILIFFLYFLYSLWTSVTFHIISYICISIRTFDTSIRGDLSKMFWKENNSNFHMIPITQNTNFTPCGRFYQITSQMVNNYILVKITTSTLKYLWETRSKVVNFKVQELAVATMLFHPVHVILIVCPYLFTACK